MLVELDRLYILAGPKTDDGSGDLAEVCLKHLTLVYIVSQFLPPNGYCDLSTRLSDNLVPLEQEL